MTEEPRSEAELADLAVRKLGNAMSGKQDWLIFGPGENPDLVFGHVTAFIEEWPVISERATIRRLADGHVIYFDPAQAETPSA
jgi:hypothetical protein